MGSKLVVFSDHKLLEGLSIKSRLDEELGDMVNFILQFDLTVRYKPGHANLEAYSLSCSPVLTKTGNNICLNGIILDQK